MTSTFHYKNRMRVGIPLRTNAVTDIYLIFLGQNNDFYPLLQESHACQFPFKGEGTI